MIVKITDSALRAKNAAVIAATGRRVSASMRFPLFTNVANASWATQMAMAERSMQLARIKLSLGRKAFAVRPGDPIRLTYSPYSITDRVFLVLSMEETDIESERIIITAIEYLDYAAGIPDVVGAVALTAAGASTMAVDAITHHIVREPPYVMAETPGTVVPIIGRETGNETGAYLYCSVDGGTSYTRIGSTSTYSVHGVLESDLSETGNTVDVTISIDASRLSSDANAHTKNSNLILINDEIVSFTTITANGGDSYTVSDLARGLYGTTAAAHAIGDDSWSLDGLDQIQSTILHAGNTYYFKAVPYNGSAVGDISEATAASLSYVGLSQLPLPVADLTANGSGSGATYSTDIVLAWDPANRGSSSVPTSFDTCEALHRVEVEVSSVVVRTVESGQANPFFDGWTYTSSMNTADNGSLAASVTLRVYQFFDADRVSDPVEIVVTKV